MDRADQWVALSECGTGVDDFPRVNFPRAVRIADFHLVAEHLGELADAWEPGGPEAAKERSDRCYSTLKHEGAGRSPRNRSHWTGPAGRSWPSRSIAR